MFCKENMIILTVYALFFYLAGVSFFTEPDRPRGYSSGKYSCPLYQKLIPALKIVFAND